MFDPSNDDEAIFDPYDDGTNDEPIMDEFGNLLDPDEVEDTDDDEDTDETPLSLDDDVIDATTESEIHE